MSKLIAYSVIILTINFVLAESEFNLEYFYSKNNYTTKDYYGRYNPESAIAACPKSDIWPSSADLPQVPDPDCGPKVGISSDQAYGCDIPSHAMGIDLARSVVGIFYPVTPHRWKLMCTGTIIDKHWILTAAHCAAKSGVRDKNNPDAGQFMDELKSDPLLVVPWQAKKNMVPIEINDESQLELGPYKVKTIYIPYHFNFYDEDVPLHYYVQGDYALLELEHNLPDVTVNNIDHWFKPITLATSKTKLFKNKKLWAAGYGNNETQTLDGKLRYRDEYVFTDYDLEQIAVTGSIPILYHESPSAWKFIGDGDSGGPILDYPANKTLSIVGVISSANCYWPGFFAPEHEALSYAVNIPNYSSLISDMVHNSVARSFTRCLSPSGACAADQMIYIPNYNYNSISINSVNPINKQINYYQQPIPTGAGPAKIIFDDRGWYAYVINSLSDSISMYQVIQDGGLSALQPKRDILQVTGGASTVDIAYYNGYIYVVSAINNSISIYKQNINGTLNYAGRQYLDGIGAKSITFKDGFAYILDPYNILTYNVSSVTGALSLSERSIEHFNEYNVLKFGKGYFSKFAFVLSAQGRTISIFRKNPNGSLDFINIIQLDAAPTDIEFSNNDELAFITSSTANTLSVFTVKLTGMQLVQQIKTLAKPDRVLLDPAGDDILVSYPQISEVGIYKINNKYPYLSKDSIAVSTRGYTPAMIATLPK